MQRVISYCKSHMQITKQTPRLHQTYGFELRIHSRPFKKRYIVEQSTFANATFLNCGCVVEACIFRNSRTPLTKRSFPVDKATCLLLLIFTKKKACIDFRQSTLQKRCTVEPFISENVNFLIFGCVVEAFDRSVLSEIVGLLIRNHHFR